MEGGSPGRSLRARHRRTRGWRDRAHRRRRRSANGVFLIDPVVEALWQKCRLAPIRSLNKPLHDHPHRIIKGTIEGLAFSHSQGQTRRAATIAPEIYAETGHRISASARAGACLFVSLNKETNHGKGTSMHS